MKYTTAVLLLIGAMTSTEAVRLSIDSNSGAEKHNANDLKLAQQKAKEAADKVAKSNAKIQKLKA